MEFYKHSGAIPIGAVVLILVAGLITVVVGGVIYSFAIVYIPIVYVSVLLTFGYGALIGAVVGWAALAGKLRNNFILTSLALLFGALGLYAAWGMDTLARIGLEVGLLGFHPLILWGYMGYFYENGSWGLTEGEAVTGPLLAAVWLAEGLIILGMSLVVARAWGTKLPFCERCDQWTTQEQGVLYFAADPQDLRWQRVQMGDLQAIDEFKPGVGDEGSGVRLDLASCPSCREGGFLTAQAVTFTVDQNGALSEKTTPVFTHLVIDQAAVDYLRVKAAQVASEGEQAAATAEGET
jgi:hypothetical protein